MRPATRPLLPLWAAVAASLVGGLLLTVAFPPLGWWPLTFVAVVLALLGLVGRGVWASALVGFAFGVGFFFVNLFFTARYLGPVPWIALSTLEALLTAAGAVPITLAYRWMPRVLPGTIGRLIVLPVLVAGLWTLREQIVGSWPYGGFPWGRLAVTQVGSPLAHLVSWVGMSGLSFLIVLACGLGIGLVGFVRADRSRVRVRWALPTVAVLVLLFVVPAFPTTSSGTMRVGSVQGNGPAGYFDVRARGAVLEAQVAASRPLFGQRMDVLLWPEGGVDSDPTSNRATAYALDQVAQQVGAPLLINAATKRGAEYFNSSILWPQGTNAGDSGLQTYDKRHPVPFGEYVPDRPFWESLAPDLIGLIGLEYTPGTAAPVMDVNGISAGLAICFDVIYDDVIWDGASGGAQVYLLQTNNADFRGTDENLQQLAFARVRAIETGRSVVNLSTVGTSQVIAADGSEIDGLPVDAAGHMLTDVPLHTGLTPAVVIGPAVKLVLGWGSVAALLVIGVLAAIAGRRGRNAKTPAPEGTGVSDSL